MDEIRANTKEQQSNVDEINDKIEYAMNNSICVSSERTMRVDVAIIWHALNEYRMGVETVKIQFVSL